MYMNSSEGKVKADQEEPRQDKNDQKSDIFEL